MRLWINTLLRLAAGTYFVLTSLYGLLAFLPYTYCAFIKAPPYPWMPWFTHHQTALYWVAATAGLVAASGSSLLVSWKNKNAPFLAGTCVLIAVGVYLSIWPFLPSLQSNRAAYWWSLVALLPVLALALWRPKALAGPAPDANTGALGNQVYGYSAGLLVAFAVSLMYSVGARIRIYSESHALGFHSQDLELALWSLISHFVLAVAILSALNLISLVAVKASQPRAMRRVLTGTLIFAALAKLACPIPRCRPMIPC